MLLKENELKSFYQQQCHKQIEMMCSEDKLEKVFSNFMITFKEYRNMENSELLTGKFVLSSIFYKYLKNISLWIYGAS